MPPRHERTPCLAEWKELELGTGNRNLWNMGAGCSGLCSDMVQLAPHMDSPKLCEPRARVCPASWENLLPRAISLFLLSAALPVSAAQASPPPPSIAHVCCSQLTSPAGEKLWDTTAMATSKAMSGWGASCAVSKLQRNWEAGRQV